MPTITEKDNSTVEAARIAQDAARRYMDESASIGRGYFSTWNATALAALRTTFDLQNAMIQSSRTIMDAAAQANRGWFDQAVDSIHKGQDASAKLVAAGMDMVESTLPRPRA